MANTFSSREKLSPQNQKPPDLIFAQKRDEVQGTSSSKANSSSSGLRIVHATNERVRLRATDEEASLKLDGISQILQQCIGVTSVDVNGKTGSLVINFDKNKLSLKGILAILQELGIDKKVTPDAVESQDPFAAWKSLDFWKEQTIDLIPLLTGLAVTSRLGVSGLASIPVYFVVANAMRQIIASLSEARSEQSNSQATNTKIYADSTSKIEKTPGLGKSEEVERTSTIIQEKTAPPAVTNQFPKTEKIEYSVAHVIPGRIRLHIPRIAEDSAYARRLERLLERDPRVTNIRIKRNIASVTIRHSERQLPISHWVDLMQSALATNTANDSKDARTVSSKQSFNPSDIQIETQSIIKPSQKTLQIEDSSEIIPAKNPESNLQVSSLWANMKAPGLSYSLALMANLPLN